MKKIILASLLAASVATSAFAVGTPGQGDSGRAPAGAVQMITLNGTCTPVAPATTCTPPKATCNYVPATTGRNAQPATWNCSGMPAVASVIFAGTDKATVTCAPSQGDWTCKQTAKSDRP